MEILKTARQASYQFNKRNNYKYNQEEVVAEANAILCEALETFQENKGRKLESWVAFCVHRELRKRFKEEMEFLEFDELYMKPSNLNNPEKLTILKETLNSFSKVSNEIINLILTGSIESNKKNEAKKEIKNKLRNMGYSWNTIQHGFHELKIYANSLT